MIALSLVKRLSNSTSLANMSKKARAQLLQLQTM
nr:MAG TPA: hypothetical protein [Caudoviricetes sp.]